MHRYSAGPSHFQLEALHKDILDAVSRVRHIEIQLQEYWIYDRNARVSKRELMALRDIVSKLIKENER